MHLFFQQCPEAEITPRPQPEVLFVLLVLSLAQIHLSVQHFISQTTLVINRQRLLSRSFL